MGFAGWSVCRRLGNSWRRPFTAIPALTFDAGWMTLQAIGVRGNTVRVGGARIVRATSRRSVHVRGGHRFLLRGGRFPRGHRPPRGVGKVGKEAYANSKMAKSAARNSSMSSPKIAVTSPRMTKRISIFLYSLTCSFSRSRHRDSGQSLIQLTPGRRPYSSCASRVRLARGGMCRLTTPHLACLI